MKILHTLLFAALLPFTAYAGASTLADYKSNDLLNDTVVSLADYNDTLLILTFFEPDCPWCYRQLKALNKLSKQCRHIQAVAVGIHGNRQQLRKEARRAKIQFPAITASLAFQRSIGKIPATPWNILIENGEIKATLRGYHSYEKFRQAFSDICQ